MVTKGSQFQTKSFKDLQNKWYALLETKEFKDIEDKKERIKDHKSIADLCRRQYFDKNIRETTEEYYSWAVLMTIEGTFKCERDETAWELHSQGWIGTQIAKKMNYKNRKWINRVLKKVRAYLKQ